MMITTYALVQYVVLNLVLYTVSLELIEKWDAYPIEYRLRNKPSTLVTVSSIVIGFTYRLAYIPFDLILGKTRLYRWTKVPAYLLNLAIQVVISTPAYFIVYLSLTIGEWLNIRKVVNYYGARQGQSRSYESSSLRYPD